ncbi:MAG: hypothetical protein GQ538_11310, partial [Xanthomonadales bacterium]|nr:hypothetical protein [Xanthomonadales bacterium]
MNKKRAALRHLWPSMLVLAIIASLILLVWYPYPFLQFKANDKFSLTLLAAAVFFGPAMTWFLYKKDKWGLVFDLVVVVLIQIAAMTWSTYALYQNRPYFMVFTVDRFEVLSIREVEFTNPGQLKFLDKPTVGPIMLYANMPIEPKSFQKLLKEVMFEGKPDLQFRPEFWSFYSERQVQTLAVSKPLSALRHSRPESANSIDKLVRQHGGDIEQLRFVPGMIKDSQF